MTRGTLTRMFRIDHQHNSLYHRNSLFILRYPIPRQIEAFPSPCRVDHGIVLRLQVEVWKRRVSTNCREQCPHQVGGYISRHQTAAKGWFVKQRVGLVVAESKVHIGREEKSVDWRQSASILYRLGLRYCHRCICWGCGCLLLTRRVKPLRGLLFLRVRQRRYR